MTLPGFCRVSASVRQRTLAVYDMDAINVVSVLSSRVPSSRMQRSRVQSKRQRSERKDTAMSVTKSIVHDEDQGRFVIYVDDQEAGFAEYSQADGVRDFNHTVVDPKYRGQGLSKPLISEALLGTKEANLKIKASCSAVAAFVEKNPEFKELLAS